MEISSNLTLELFNQPFLLEKRISLLYAIKHTGSISKAAKEVPMSYKSAWEAVDAMNNLSHTPLVKKLTGGVGGGGTQLTEYGQNILNTYSLLKDEQIKFLERLSDLTDIDTGTLKTIGRLNMQISARNQIQAQIESIILGRVNAKISLHLKSGHSLMCVITKEAVESLGFRQGDSATAIFKSNSVTLGVGEQVPTREINTFFGKVVHITRGETNSEVVVDIGHQDVIVSVISTETLDALKREEGSDIHALVKPSDVMLGR